MIKNTQEYSSARKSVQAKANALKQFLKEHQIDTYDGVVYAFGSSKSLFYGALRFGKIDNWQKKS